jgi:hypothetical protein
MKRTLLVTLTGMMMLTAAFAQVNARRENQQDRIAQGVRSGSLTAGETANLEKKEAAINQEVRADRALNGGKLTSQERKIVNGQQNNMSKQIYNDKHNAAVQHYGANEVDTRRANQQARIANGIASGKLTAGQTARLEKGESAINKEVRSERVANGGHLTGAEKTAVNAQQNKMSGKIYRAKHN